jgi:DNA (cytosine-5)-methyltransferase 1
MTQLRPRSVPVIDLFAGPGGLGEGFSSFRCSGAHAPFRIHLSIEKNPIAHSTLRLRSFYRQFSETAVPEQYYDVLRGKLSMNELYDAFSEEAFAADREAWNATLGDTLGP